MLYTILGRVPELDPSCYIAPSADIIGSVRVGAEASVWFGCVLRGDNDWIELGAGTNVQDGTVIHTDTGFPTRLGARVSVGHCAFLHNCTIGEESLIGNGARVMDRVTIGRHSIVAAGSLIAPDKEIPDGVVVMGTPGKIVREVTERDLALIQRVAESYRRRAGVYQDLAVWTAPK
jgi:carbonic anhydrase/acetyltransferase-like protein (isoleucine patch superfamily)